MVVLECLRIAIYKRKCLYYRAAALAKLVSPAKPPFCAPAARAGRSKINELNKRVA
jgi:hypothetical protein